MLLHQAIHRIHLRLRQRFLLFRTRANHCAVKRIFSQRQQPLLNAKIEQRSHMSDFVVPGTCGPILIIQHLMPPLQYSEVVDTGGVKRRKTFKRANHFLITPLCRRS